MKKTKVILVTIAMAVLAISVTIISCKKEKELTSTNTDMSINPSENMDAYLLSLKEKLQSAKKNGEFIDLEQAERDLGNLLNFDFGNANYPSNMYHVDTIHAKLELSQGQVDLLQLAITYNDAFNSILETYRSIDLPEKSISSISCTISEAETKDGETENVEIVVVTRGLGGDPIPANNHDTLDWRPGNFAGTCDGQFIGYYGAPEILLKWLYWSQGTPSCPNDRMYLTNVGHWDTFGYQNYDPTTGQFLIYTSFETNQDSVCISHEEMEYYYHNILNLYNQQPFIGHYIDYAIIDQRHMHGTIPALNHYYWYYCWHVRIRHGKVNCTDVPVVE